MTNNVILHGAAMIYNGCTFLFISHTGGGKSTLACFLSKQGLGYLSDDQVEIDPETMIITGKYKSIDLREGGFELLKRANLLQNNEVCFDPTPGRERYKYLPPRSLNPQYPLGPIYFLERKEQGNVIVPLTKSESMQRLITNSIYPVDVSGTYIRNIKKIAEHVQGVLRYSDMTYILRIIEKWDRNG